jgi:hypothetical protein
MVFSKTEGRVFFALKLYYTELILNNQVKYLGVIKIAN